MVGTLIHSIAFEHPRLINDDTRRIVCSCNWHLCVCVFVCTRGPLVVDRRGGLAV